MKVMQVLYSGLGGHGSVVTSLINADKEKKIEHCLLFYGIEEMLPSYKDFCKSQSIPFSFVKKNRGVLKISWPAIRKSFRQLDPDIVILHSPILIFPAWTYCLFRKKKLFVVEHTPHSTKGLAEKIASFFAILLARKTVCLSQDYRKKLQQQFRILPVMKKTIVIQNGIDLEQFHPVTKPISMEMHAGMIGRFSKQKNQAMIIDAAQKGIAAGQLGRNIHFHFAGTGEKLEELKKSVAQKKLDKQVHFHGLLNEDGVKQLLTNLDVYVHASFSETMCTSVMQAMACGLPVLGSNIPGINDIVKDDENAVLFNNDDVAGLVNGLMLMEDKALKEKMGNRSRQLAVENFSSVETFSRYLDLISR